MQEKMQKAINRITFVIWIIMLVISISANVLALTPAEITAATEVTGSAEIANVGKAIVGILQTTGIVISVIILIIIGIKYMRGSAEEKAEYKKTMMPYIIGAALIFTASVFANVLYQFFTGITTTTTTKAS